jgi:GAF domain-containing protein
VQAASADVLRVITSSPGDMKPAFEAMLANALRICDAKFGHILLYDGERFSAVHLHDVPPSYRAFWEHHGPIRPSPNTGLGRLASTKQVVHIPDLKAETAYAEGEPLRVVTVERAGARSFLAVPMLQENELVGAIVIYRQEVCPFSDKHIALVQNFAAQAVIAMENARVLSELRQSLQQQTATAEVLRLISDSPADLQPVFDRIVKNAARLCQSVLSAVYRKGAEHVHLVAHDQFSPESVAAVRKAYPAPLTSKNLISVAIRERRVVHEPDVLVSGGYSELQRTSGYRSILIVPMLRDEAAIGAIAVMRLEPQLFPKAQVELLKTFAGQAVIAIENARLFEELRDRQAELRVTFDNMGDGVVMFDANARLTAWNRNFQEMLELPDAFLALTTKNEAAALDLTGRRWNGVPLHPFNRSRCVGDQRFRTVHKMPQVRIVTDQLH